MATTFDFSLIEDSLPDAQAAAEAAFVLIDQLEEKLSYFIPSSDISQINALRAGQGVIVSVDTFACLKIAHEMFVKTNGAFDPTVGCLLTQREPWDADQDVPRGSAPRPLGQTVRLGFDLLDLDPVTRTVAVHADGVRLDLGAIGKGFALDLAAEMLRDYGITSAMLSAGQSTMLPIGLPPQQQSWIMRLRDPRDETTLVARIGLVNAALSTSSTATKNPHILDPATGQPIQAALGAWAIAPTAAESDALSTAFMVLPLEAVREYCTAHPEVSGAVFTAAGEFVPVNIPVLP